jgi:protein-arginine kinase
MRQVIVYTTNKEYSHFVELARNLIYVKKIETDEEPTKEEIVSNLKKGFEEMQLIKKGKLKTTPLNDFLNEL